MKKNNKCNFCGGKGYLYARHDCYYCNGSGKRWFFFDCNECGGTGRISGLRCPMCHDLGSKFKCKQLPISKPPSISKPSYPDYSKLPPPPGHPWWNNRNGGGYGGADGNPNTPW